MKKVLLQPAYVLQVRPYRDTSALVEIFTPDFGRISLVARGVKSGNSKIRGLLQPFRRLLISWYGAKELKSLVAAEEDGGVISVKADGLVSALYVNELLVRLLHRHEEHESLFDLYQNILKTLEGTDNISKDLRLFEKSLLQELGYGVMLEYNAETGEPIDQNERYLYQVEVGPVPYNPVVSGSIINTSLSKNKVGIIVHGESLLSLARGNLDDARSVQESKKLMRYIINRYLEGKPVKSRELLAVSY